MSAHPSRPTNHHQPYQRVWSPLPALLATQKASASTRVLSTYELVDMIVCHLPWDHWTKLDRTRLISPLWNNVCLTSPGVKQKLFLRPYSSHAAIEWRMDLAQHEGNPLAPVYVEDCEPVCPTFPGLLVESNHLGHLSRSLIVNLHPALQVIDERRLWDCAVRVSRNWIMNNFLPRNSPTHLGLLVTQPPVTEILISRDYCKGPQLAPWGIVVRNSNGVTFRNIADALEALREKRYYSESYTWDPTRPWSRGTKVVRARMMTYATSLRLDLGAVASSDARWVKRARAEWRAARGRTVESVTDASINEKGHGKVSPMKQEEGAA